MTVDLLHTLGAKITLGYHLHLYLGALNAVALTNHGAKGAVTREVAVTRYQKVAQVNAIVGIALQWINGCKEAVHLLDGIGHENRLEVVAILQTATDTSCDGIDILQNRRILDAHHIGRGLGLDVFARKDIAEGLGFFAISTTYGEVAQTLQSNLLGMRWTTNASEILVRYIVYLMKILATNEILIRYDTLNSCEYKLIAYTRLKLLEVTLEVR